MCGRYTIIAKAEEIEKRFKIEVPEMYQPRYNAAPTQILPVITNKNPNGLSFFRWGLIPPWAKDISIGSKMINARSETITEKSSFKNPFKSKRCLVISDGYYEWKRTSKKSKIPYRIKLKSNDLFTYAGLWEEYTQDNQTTIHSFTILTTQSSKSTSSIHDRMPVILSQENEELWLTDETSSNDLLEVLTPYPDDDTEIYTVSNLVNSVQNDDDRLIKPTPAMDQSGNLSLFD
jgi:putative SOS response-associated peptidase YedK